MSRCDPLRHPLAAVTLLAFCVAPNAACSEQPSPSQTTASLTASAPDAAATSTPSSAPSSSAAPEGPCPSGMRLVEGAWCKNAVQTCLAWNEVNVTGKVERNQCKQYREPAECLDRSRQPMRFCMDTYEWPNEEGAIPRNLTSWQEAKDTCEVIGKRLCTEDEFTFACEGEAMRPHVHGFTRDGSICNYDREYRLRTFNFAKHDACMSDEACRAALAAIDQRLPAGAMPRCVSDHGVHDLNGNVNEWVELPGKGFSKRAGLKGGWWGPVRDRCRPITTFHGESDFGYEVGFRCCKNAR